MNTTIIITIQEFADDIKNIILDENPALLTQTEANSYKGTYSFDNSDNWFGDRHNSLNTIVNMIIANNESTNNIINSVNAFTEKKNCKNSVQIIKLKADEIYV